MEDQVLKSGGSEVNSCLEQSVCWFFFVVVFFEKAI